MRAQLAADYAEDRGTDQCSALHLVPTASDPIGQQRAVYGESQRMNPAAAAASAIVAFGALASFLYIGGGHHHRHHRQDRLTVVQLADLQPPPPPPQSPTKVQPKQDRPAEIVVPQAIVTTSAPPSPVASTTVKPAVPASTGTSEVSTPVVAPAPPAQETANVGDLSARMISATPPSYPIDARRSQQQGTVVLSVMLGIDGRVANISVSRSSGSNSLDRAALSAVKRWRWAPMMRNGNPVLVQGMVTIPFVLHA